MIIGICGKSGSGKSTLTEKIIKRYNNTINLDIDKIGHQITNKEEVKQLLIKKYGENILTNNNIDRKKLSQIVFSKAKEMKKLTQITWPHMEKEIDKFLLNNKNKIVVLDWQLLPKTKFFKKCDIKILLDIPIKIRKERIIKRDNITKEEFYLREKASVKYNKKSFDYIIKEKGILEINI